MGTLRDYLSHGVKDSSGLYVCKITIKTHTPAFRIVEKQKMG